MMSYCLTKSPFRTNNEHPIKERAMSATAGRALPPQEGLTALRERMERLARGSVGDHGVLPFGVSAIEAAMPGGGLARGVLHEIGGLGGDEEDGAVPGAFLAGILARLVP